MPRREFIHKRKQVEATFKLNVVEITPGIAEGLIDLSRKLSEISVVSPDYALKKLVRATIETMMEMESEILHGTSDLEPVGLLNALE